MRGRGFGGGGGGGGVGCVMAGVGQWSGEALMPPLITTGD